MKAYYRVSFRVFREADEQIEALLMVAGVSDCRRKIERKISNVDVWLAYGDPRMTRLLEVLQKRDYLSSVTAVREFEPIDYAQAWLFSLDTVGPLTMTKESPDEADWDMSHLCAGCNTGAIQRSGMRLKKSSLPKVSDVTWTGVREIHFSDKLKHAVERHFGSSADFIQDLDAKNPRKTLPWWQLLPEHVLQPMSKATAGLQREIACRECEYGNYCITGVDFDEPIYDMTTKQIESLPPFSRTYEYWGKANMVARPNWVVHYPRQGIMVNAKCREFLVSQKIRHLSFTPITVRLKGAEVVQ